MSDNSPARHALADLTTLGLGGPAGRLVTAESADGIVSAVHAAARSAEPLLVLGGGSNVVIGDVGFPGTVLLVRSSGVEVVGEHGDAVSLRVAAGHPWDDCVARTVADGLSGIECLSGIPGASGSTPIQNVGAYGQDVSQTIEAVTVYDRTEGETVVFSPADCRFEYRNSVFKYTDRWVVLDVTFRLRRDPLSGPVGHAELARLLGVGENGRVPLADVRAAVLELRRGKGMVLDPGDPDTDSVGSFFTNPVLSAAAYAELSRRFDGVEPPAWPGVDGVMKVSAAWLIERAGFERGYARGPVAISSKHILALTHRGGGTTGELLELATEIRDRVHERFGVTLRPEPVLVGCEL
ncbi:UDP-N-acetylenolpyruvoylglucosamine reductase [Catellatospora methionotrophica]|uniref:UDP-N-acetylenolpyruvoylglucosamine reductase n=1 Tax=Catellatospora methionotrophica TaxID=121620 RepID=A0A8J3LRQ9_9ACTN|nr:UDP-N-acetylmuramate dehydrogenase [Catellatospora methionotrophica]GIG17700.1 UDP-N-acetylenolpyruvoylglucosamine reductase [Catellatospora methionotrophica]